MNERMPRTLPSPDATLFQQAEYFDAHPEDITPDYLNNFRLWLPGSAYIDFIEAHLDDPQSGPGDKHSDLWMHQTRREFIGTVARTVAGMPDIMNAIRSGVKDAELNARIIPLYLALRKLGYSHYDLVV